MYLGPYSARGFHPFILRDIHIEIYKPATHCCVDILMLYAFTQETQANVPLVSSLFIYHLSSKQHLSSSALLLLELCFK